jgi:hypothetical protein
MYQRHPEEELFQIVAKEDSFQVTFSKGSTLVYSIGVNTVSSNGVPVTVPGQWRDFNASGKSITMNSGQTMYVKAKLSNKPTPIAGYGIGTFAFNKKCDVRGNIMSLFYGSHYKGYFDFKREYNLNINEHSPEYKYVFEQLFKNCTGLTSAVELRLPATTIPVGCYKYMFSGCTNLQTPPTISATTWPDEACYGMFSGCTNLKQIMSAPNITASTRTCMAMYKDCSTLTTTTRYSIPTKITANSRETCKSMFENCTSLSAYTNTATVTLTSQNVGEAGFESAFANCTALTKTTHINLKEVPSQAFKGMYAGCTKLRTIQQFTPQKIGYEGCREMFNGCTALVSGNTLLSATTVVNDYGCMLMFANCTALTKIPKLTYNQLGNYSLQEMFAQCTALTNVTGVVSATTMGVGAYKWCFYNCSNLLYIPSLPMTALKAECYYGMFENCTSLKWRPNTTTTPEEDDEITTLPPSEGGTLPPGEGGTLPPIGLTTLTVTYEEEDYTGWPTERLVLPAIGLARQCYQYMFRGCTSLVEAPNILAESMSDTSCGGMFQDCVNLEIPPVLYATKLAERCYADMFIGCTSLVVAPMLPATTLAPRCYVSMFSGCTNLQQVVMMGQNFTALKNNGEDPLENWFNGVAPASSDYGRMLFLNFDNDCGNDYNALYLNYPAKWGIGKGFTPIKYTGKFTTKPMAGTANSTTIFYDCVSDVRTILRLRGYNTNDHVTHDYRVQNVHYHGAFESDTFVLPTPSTQRTISVCQAVDRSTIAADDSDANNALKYCAVTTQQANDLLSWVMETGKTHGAEVFNIYRPKSGYDGACLTLEINGYNDFEFYIADNVTNGDACFIARIGYIYKGDGLMYYRDIGTTEFTKTTQWLINEYKHIHIGGLSAEETYTITIVFSILNEDKRENPIPNSGYVLIPKKQDKQLIYVNTLQYPATQEAYTILGTGTSGNNVWRKSTSYNPNTSKYDGAYHTVAGTTGATMQIRITGYDYFKIYVRADSGWHMNYLLVSQLDESVNASTSYDNASVVYYHTKDKHVSETGETGYTLVEFRNLDGFTHTITLCYCKNDMENDDVYGSTDMCYLLIPKNQNKT